MQQTKKNILLLIAFFLFFTPSFATSYRIQNALYFSTGITRAAALQRVVPIDTKRVFPSYEALDAYITDIVQQLENLRLLDNIYSQYTCVDEKDGVCLVDLSITVNDSKHLLGLPKFSYNSNTGSELKLKLKDTNFLGLLNTFNLDFNGKLEQESEQDNPDVSLGINFDYDWPFTLLNLQHSWNNDFSFSWILGDDLPEFSLNTGFTTDIPVGQHTCELNFKQSVIRNKDYSTYGDALYAVENASISMPLTIGKINNSIKVLYTPSISYTYNWDADSISLSNEDLASPLIAVGQKLSTSRINWKNNFRDGFLLNGTESLGWNFETQCFIPTVALTAEGYKAFKYAGLCSRLYIMGMLNSNEKIGDSLRGIRDNQYYADGSYYALKVPAAIVFSVDCPIHIITTNWLGWGKSLFGTYDLFPQPAKFLFWLPHKLFKYLDFELQLSPFVDAALTRNRNDDSTFSVKDGFYDAGFEFLVYPLKWKSYVIRGSIGFDIGRLLLSDYLDTSWRDTAISCYEIYFGLGLQY